MICHKISAYQSPQGRQIVADLTNITALAMDLTSGSDTVTRCS
jgi:hypothetical protein